MFFARFCSLMLVLALGLSTVGFGVARGQAPAVGQMVICTGMGIVTLSVDAEGSPVETHTLCPDAALVSLAAVASVSLVVKSIDASLAWLDWPQDAQLSRVFSPLTRSARAPPV
ncbi:hypothetical protein [Aliiruegeria sabulilitoris]|uniref:hypothetical protein n=1 Tax=Aliiruegeria sabulilitoris TaxID=1510458 RepID=UPI00083559B1|nr:hypothetical protein [Aliiruegeria sabulilitoris]NDR57381.1 hypothetical protein [Pseudoruegeria sp. M32A2M]